MAQMQALLKIKADVEGEGKINALGRAIGGLSGTAGRVSGGLKGLAGAAGGLSGALGSLVPLATGAGLAAMAKGAIDAADNMNDLSQKTGVSVESLSKFQQAANAGGTSIEGVGAAMIKLSKGMTTGKMPAIDALNELGINAKDASGKLKGTDQIMLEVADKFKSMPDGAGKTALALQLFGKAGADMIPMLNGGSKAITDLSATMTGPFAKGADSLNDKLAALQGKLLGLGVQIGTALMPMLNVIADLVMGLANAFVAMPGPLQAIVGGAVALAAAFVVLAPAISAVISIAGALAGLQIGATIAGWAGVIGPAITAITAAFTGLLAWLTGTLVPGLVAIFSGPVGWTVLAVAAVVAMVVLFRKPIMEFFTWLGGAIAEGLKALWQWSEPIRKFWVDAFSTVGNTVKQALSAIGGVLEWAFKAWYAITYQAWVQPWINLWDKVLREPVSKLGDWIKGIWKGITDFFGSNVIKPIQTGWDVLMKALPNAMKKLGDAVKGVWNGIVTTIKNAFRSVLQFIANGINSAGRLVNQLIGAFNKLPGPDIPMVPTITVPAFAKGGYVGGGTLAMVGEAGPEYIIPERKMAQASMNYLNGARGGAVIPAYAQGGYVGGSAQINVTTGPVMQQDGQQYVSMADLEKAMRKTADGIYSSLRTPAGRYAIGVR